MKTLILTEKPSVAMDFARGLGIRGKRDGYIENRQGVVTSSKRTKKSQPPPLLYSLTDLQQDANIRFGFSAKQTLEIAQASCETTKVSGVRFQVSAQPVAS